MGLLYVEKNKGFLIHWHCDTREIKMMDIHILGSAFTLWIFTITINTVT